MGEAVVRDFVRIAADYARDVVAGRILACRLVKLACQRHLDGLKKQRRKDYAYRLDKAAATKVCRFLELLPHVKGKWARERQRIVLEPWQVFIEVNVWGWKRKRDGLRRYRRAYIEIPRKNAKSTTTAGNGLFMLVEDNEHGAEIYSGATTEKQAWEVFGPARLMAKNTPELVEHYGVVVGAKNMHVPGSASKFEPIIGKPGDGASPSMSITDEYHEHASPEQYDTMVTGMGAREQPLAWVITTAGSDTAGPCYALRTQSIEMLEGKVQDDELFALIYTIDGDVDWTSERALRMANPNMGVSVFEDFLRGEQQRAVNNPRDQAKFKTKHLNLWVTAAAPYFNAELLKRLGDPALRREDFVGQQCVMAGDLGAKLDLACVVTLFAREIGEVGEKGEPEMRRHYYAFCRSYIPSARAEEPERRHYAEWAEKDYLVLTPGDQTDYDYIEADIKSDGERFQVLQIGMDPWNATQVITHLQNHFGLDKVIEVPQTTPHLSNPMKEVQAAIVSGRFHHDGNPAFEWMMGNVTAQEDRNENVFPRKEQPEKKIDGAVATIIAMGRALAAFEAPAKPTLAFIG